MEVRGKRLALAFNDKLSGELAKLIVDYESLVRGAGKGTTSFDLILSAINLDAYPEELRARLSELMPSWHK